MLTNKISPHLTLSLFESDDELKLHNITKGIFPKLSRQSIFINRVGAFEPEVIYLAPRKTSYLLNLNNVITKNLIVNGIVPDNYYLPDMWIPHISLGVQLTSDELVKVLEIVKKDFVPFKVAVEKLVLVKCNPYKKIVEYIINK